MGFTVTVSHRPRLLGVAVRGFASYADLCAVVDLTAGLAEAHAYPRCVIDLRKVEVDLTTAEHFRLGSYSADRLGALDRVASLVGDRYSDAISTQAAQKLGMRLRSFTDVDEAMAWLSQETVAV